ncbi:geranylgeranylglycerol-phosphate geranylgeranyltransferase [uncultured Flavobacterium sp.]|uniref:geranylgeranylglycerol-phosphate geranylgeranyltransferase n=1 Tax=uncultured Flavobacterium sp. TaxID=165435 RepID=UPI0030C81328
MNFLKLIRYQNLLIIALVQAVFHFGFLKQQDELLLALNDIEFVLLILATVCIAAAGYIINNIVDQETDAISKPEKVIVGKHISEKTAYNYYLAFNIVGVILGFFLANIIFKESFAAIFIVVSFVLYLYATQFKQSLLAGNFLVSFLVAFSIILVGVFDLYPVITVENRQFLNVLFQIILDYALFAFLLTFIREVVKDIEDYEGDLKTGMNTLPIVLGKEKTQKVIFGISFIPLLALLYYLNENFTHLEYVIYYVLGLVVAPMLYFIVKLWPAKTQKDFNHLSTVLKFIMITGILSIIVITYNLNNLATLG